MLHLLAWAASHFYMEQNKREVLLVVDTSYSMKAKFGQVRRWLDDFEQDARYKKIVVGTDKAFLGALADLESREVVFRTAFGKLNADNLQAAISLADYPDTIKGFGHVKERNVEQANQKRMALRAGFKNVDGLESLEAAE